MLTDKDKKYLESSPKWIKGLSTFSIILMVLSAVSYIAIEKNIYNTGMTEIQKGIDKYEGIKVETEFEQKLKDEILKLSYGFKKMNAGVAKGLGFFVGFIIFTVGIFTLLNVRIRKKYLDIINRMKKE